MDVNLLRSIVTVVAFAVFVAIGVWAYMPSRRQQFEDAASLPLRDGE